MLPCSCKRHEYASLVQFGVVGYADGVRISVLGFADRALLDRCLLGLQP